MSNSPETLTRPGSLHSAGEEARPTQDGFQLAGRATQELLWDWDLVGGEIVWAGATQPYFGVPPEQITPVRGDRYGTWAARVHPDDLEAAETASLTAIESGAESWEHEYRFRRLDDTYANILERAVIARDEAGRALRIVGAMRDVSARRTAETTSRLAAIVASSSEAIVGKTLDGVVTSWNAAAERIFGYSEREMLGQSIFRLIPEELHDTERDLLERLHRGERVEYADAVRIRKDGTRIDIALSVSPIWDASGVIVGASSIKRDITERKRADAELVRREERYRALVLATTSIVWIADSEGRFATPQTSWENYTGQSWHEQEGFGWMDAIQSDDRQSVQASWADARERRAIWESRGGRLWSVAHQGHRHFVARAVPVIGRDGTVREWIGTVTDVEDRWLAEERLRQADRMESVGRLAGGIAHEANNQMTVILGAVEFLGRAIRDPVARVDVDHIRRAAHRTASITQQLLAFSRRQVLQPVIVDLNAIVTTLEPILQRALGEVSRVELRLAGDLGQVRADPGQLDQVLLNLALNARDAMPDGGTLTIETMNLTVEEQAAAEKGLDPIAPGRYAALIVTDTGSGMKKETLAHIFEPFFTTKDVGQGTGLGLATVYGIMKQSGGFVTAHSEPGRGASFRIYLPLMGVEREDERASSQGVSGGGTESVLVAEDDPVVRAILARLLREYGYTVLEARDGSHALELAESAPAPPDLVIADVVMPGVPGKRLAEALDARWPGLPVLFISGYSGLDTVRRGLMDQGMEVMQKPLEPASVAKKVRQILDARRISRSVSIVSASDADLSGR